MTFVCPLCENRHTDGRKKTIEHVIPDWRFDKDGIYRDKQLEFSRKIPNVREGKDGRIKMHICRPCNGWLAKHFENPTKSLLESMESGRSNNIVELSGLRLASYYTKDAVMRSIWESQRGLFPVFDRRDIEIFRETGQPFYDSSVYVGMSPGIKGVGTVFPPAQLLFTREQASLPEGSAIYTSGHAYMCVIIIRHKGIDRVPRLLQGKLGLFDVPPTNNLLKRIWPSGQTFRWPLDAAIHPLMFEKLARAYYIEGMPDDGNISYRWS